MNTDADIWMGFAKTFGMLFVVLAFFLLALYLFRRFSGGMGVKGGADLIKVLSVHHLAPKEKLVLVSVQDETILIGVTPNRISSLANLGQTPELLEKTKNQGSGFADLLGRTLKQRTSQQIKAKPGSATLPAGESAKGQDHD
ncbi:MAG: flagellar biosynthetic protein FliO [Desulfobacterales bacterium]|nr:flagellar biosynthetic protein FliO [Desulfobacterales bacterium]